MPKPIKKSCPNCGAVRVLQERYFGLHPLTKDSRITDQEINIDSHGIFPVSIMMCKECGLIQLISATFHPQPIAAE